ncbi:hypothetical protein DVDV_0564 [Desulfovibrio sp. DV]|nr:hypothetical protein DVDV_0564 [Desulfovibrio sp. DV]
MGTVRHGDILFVMWSFGKERCHNTEAVTTVWAGSASGST